jgi:hypothetical protein
MITRSSPRHERKFVPEGLSVAGALALVRRHPAAFVEAYPERIVNNLYFDSPGLVNYFDHVTGAGRRRKVRIRWYGADNGLIERPVLECKVRRGAVSWKESLALPPARADGGAGEALVAACMGAPELPDEFRHLLRFLRPVLANRYRRCYFVSPQWGIRLTVDYQLEFFGLRAKGQRPWPAFAPGPPVVLELKYPAQKAEEVASIANQFPFRPVRCSKYVLGVQIVCGG